jgi:phosphate acetyltransferase
MFRDQYMLLRLDEERAVRAIPRLLPDDAQLRADGWRIVSDVLAPAATCRRGRRACSGSRRCSPCPPAPSRLPGCRPPRPPRNATTSTTADRGRAKHPPMATAVAHPATRSRSRAPSKPRVSAAEADPGRPAGAHARCGGSAGLDIAAFELVESSTATIRRPRRSSWCVRARRGLMKGSLHTDELMGAVVARDTGIRTARRISHCFVMDVPATTSADHHRCRGQHRADARGQGRHRPERHRPRHALASRGARRDPERDGDGQPEGASTIEAAALCKMADRGQITGALLDGPLALDNAISPDAAAIKHIVSPVAGKANVLIVPDLEAGNMLAKSLSFLAGADAAGIVLGARVPIILTSRADSLLTRLASCAVSVLVAAARRASLATAIA